MTRAAYPRSKLRTWGCVPPQTRGQGKQTARSTRASQSSMTAGSRSLLASTPASSQRTYSPPAISPQTWRRPRMEAARSRVGSWDVVPERSARRGREHWRCACQGVEEARVVRHVAEQHAAKSSRDQDKTAARPKCARVSGKSSGLCYRSKRRPHASASRNAWFTSHCHRSLVYGQYRAPAASAYYNSHVSTGHPVARPGTP
eukprot:980701-Rhodomonas_salina.1